MLPGAAIAASDRAFNQMEMAGAGGANLQPGRAVHEGAFGRVLLQRLTSAGGLGRCVAPMFPQATNATNATDPGPTCLLCTFGGGASVCGCFYGCGCGAVCVDGGVWASARKLTQRGPCHRMGLVSGVRPCRVGTGRGQTGRSRRRLQRRTTDDGGQAAGDDEARCHPPHHRGGGATAGDMDVRRLRRHVPVVSTAQFPLHPFAFEGI